MHNPNQAIVLCPPMGANFQVRHRKDIQPVLI